MAALGGALFSAPAQESGDLIPSAPERLLEILPRAMPRWKLTRSEGRSYASRGFYSRALREFTEILPPDIEEKTRTPLKVILEVRDTVEAPEQLVPFRLTDEQLLNSSMKRGKWRQYPLMLLNDGDAEAESARILVRGRWIIQLTYPDHDFRAAERWLNQLNLLKFTDLNYVRYKTEPSVVPIQSIDELDPGRNRKYWISVTSNADLDALRKKIESEYREIGWEFQAEPAPDPENSVPQEQPISKDS